MPTETSPPDAVLSSACRTSDWTALTQIRLEKSTFSYKCDPALTQR